MIFFNWEISQISEVISIFSFSGIFPKSDGRYFNSRNFFFLEEIGTDQLEKGSKVVEILEHVGQVITDLYWPIIRSVIIERFLLR